MNEDIKNTDILFDEVIYFTVKTGTGKSSLVDIIYQRHGMAKYVINFSKNMNDGDLINLLASVPANGLIVFDEIGEKFQALKRLTVPSITFGGLKVSD